MKSNIGYTFGSNLANDIPLRPNDIELLLEFGGINKDILPAYFWLTQFRNYANKGYNFIKIEDVHHFSEASQFGGNLRQVKGGGIRAFQENLNQVIQLIKVHLMPLLKELKQAHMYKVWFDKIIENDEYLAQVLDDKKGKKGDALKKIENEERNYRNERNEAINHLKDKWVTEVDQGKLWQLSRSSQEQGLDMTLLPQLFFGTYLDDPFQRKKSLKVQLDESTYQVDITGDAKNQVARFQYRFYTWLPTAIRDTQTTFNIKLASLRQFYSQIELHIQFMKPLLMEISKKNEKMNHGNFFQGFGDEDPTMVKLFDTTLSFVRVIGPQQFQKDFQLSDTEFTKFGLLVPIKALMGNCGINCPVIVYKVEGDVGHNGKKGVSKYHVKLFKEKGDTPNLQKKINTMSKKQFDELPTRILPYYYFKPFSTPELKFTQQRRQEMVQTQQGVQQAPYMINSIDFEGKVWNFVEIAAHRQKIRSDDIHLLESFIQELGAVKDELLLYLNYQEGDDLENFGIDFEPYKKKKSKKHHNDELDDSKKSLSPLDKFINVIYAPGTKSEGDGAKTLHNQKLNEAFTTAFTKCENLVIEEIWKSYSIYKKVSGFTSY